MKCTRIKIGRGGSPCSHQDGCVGWKLSVKEYTTEI